MNEPSYQDLYYRAEQAERDAMVGNFNAAEKEVELASRDLTAAQIRNDPQGITEANERLARATYQKENLEGGIQAFDEQHPALERGTYQYSQPQQQQPQRYTTADVINSMTNLSARERQWLMQHQELVATPAGQSRLQTAYWDTEEKGIQRDSDEYFDFFNERFGFPQTSYSAAQTNTGQNYVVGGQRVQQRYQQPTKSYTPETPKVNLTEREAAKIAGVDMATYKANQKKLQDLKKLGFYTDR
jgi:hypothetical protein